LARKILLADDSVTAQNMGRKILADAGYEVITVNNGSAALKKIAEQKPDLIVLDVYMPGYSGLEVCQRLKEAQETARTPVLLTVGKLEPFKPDEARRVGAEGFIVKPFEASELLSALSKLEDKIVPRSEFSKPGKPGRFARAMASVEESSRFGKNAASDEESGWKNRIAFPPKKKEKAEEEETENSPVIYNAMNRDLRTVVDPIPANKETPTESPRNEERAGQESPVDLAALATPGIPKDVTPDEIAAIAAAAAQVQATISSAIEPAEATPHTQASSVSADRAAESLPVSKIEETQIDRAKIEEANPQAGAQGETATPEQLSGTMEVAAGSKVEEKIQVAPEVVREDRRKEDRRNEDRNEAQQKDRKEEDRKEEDRKEVAVGDPRNPDLIAALASLEPVNGHSWNAVHTGNHSGHFSEEPADLPVTMAVAGPAAARWTAVPMAIDPEEAAISLELEMQKAYAAFAAAEEQHRGDEACAGATVATPNLRLSSAEQPGSIVSIPGPELANAVKEVASAAADAVGAAVTEPVPVAASYAEMGQTSAASVIEASSQSEVAAEPAESVSPDVSAEPVQRDENSLPADYQTVPDAVQKIFGTSTHESQPAARPAMAETTAPGESAGGGWANMAEKKESDLVASTAAAWASWRQIRETGSPNASPAQSAKAGKLEDEEDEDDEPATSTDSAAMAVAAGAEKTPEEALAASSAESKAIANIVDSVLAELRPKIAEEIARKLSAENK
jgi:CheY-like chemotaxis protein